MLFDFPLHRMQQFIFVFVRVGAILISLPFFGSGNVPARLKTSLAFLVSLIAYPLIKFDGIIFPSGVFPLSIALSSEVFIGLIIGHASRLVFAGVQMAGHLIGFQMGFGIVNVIDPSTSSQVSVTSQFENILAMLIFLSINAHHWFLKGIVESFSLVPLLGFHFTGAVANIMIDIFKNVFIIGIKLGAPVIAALFFTTIALGLVARTVPQINVFIIGFPLQIGIGLLMMGLTMSFFNMAMKGAFIQMGNDMYLLMKGMRQ
ncbi:MAG: flagellar type III secretion system protein FliR [Nitrospinae bacterium]|nr:flagellar type III secretion system protein FliR [Nitrospinota bacterium]